MNTIQQELNEELFDAVNNGTVEQIKQLIEGGAHVREKEGKRVEGDREIFRTINEKREAFGLLMLQMMMN